MKTSIVPIQNKLGEILEIHRMAKTIWMEHYVKYFSEKVVRVCFERYLALEVIEKQIQDGFNYYFLKANDQKAGFLALQPLKEESVLYLGKLYLLKEFRGNGIAGKAIEFSESFAKERGLASIQLQCSKVNKEAKQLYTKHGFKTLRIFIEHTVDDEISEEMIMEKRLT